MLQAALLVFITGAIKGFLFSYKYLLLNFTVLPISFGVYDVSHINVSCGQNPVALIKPAMFVVFSEQSTF